MILKTFFVFCFLYINTLVYGSIIYCAKTDFSNPLIKNCACRNKYDSTTYINCKKGEFCTEYGCSTRELDPQNKEKTHCAIWPNTKTSKSFDSCICNNKYLCSDRDICSEYFGCLPSVNVKKENNNFKKDPNFNYDTHIHIKTKILLRNPPQEIKTEIKDIIRKYYDIGDSDVSSDVSDYAYSLHTDIGPNPETFFENDYKDTEINEVRPKFKVAKYKNNRYAKTSKTVTRNTDETYFNQDLEKLTIPNNEYEYRKIIFHLSCGYEPWTRKLRTIWASEFSKEHYQFNFGGKKHNDDKIANVINHFQQETNWVSNELNEELENVNIRIGPNGESFDFRWDGKTWSNQYCADISRSNLAQIYCGPEREEIRYPSDKGYGEYQVEPRWYDFICLDYWDCNWRHYCTGDQNWGKRNEDGKAAYPKTKKQYDRVGRISMSFSAQAVDWDEVMGTHSYQTTYMYPIKYSDHKINTKQGYVSDLYIQAQYIDTIHNGGNVAAFVKGPFGYDSSSKDADQFLILTDLKFCKNNIRLEEKCICGNIVCQATGDQNKWCYYNYFSSRDEVTTSSALFDFDEHGYCSDYPLRTCEYTNETSSYVTNNKDLDPIQDLCVCGTEKCSNCEGDNDCGCKEGKTNGEGARPKILTPYTGEPYISCNFKLNVFGQSDTKTLVPILGPSCEHTHGVHVNKRRCACYADSEGDKTKDTALTQVHWSDYFNGQYCDREKKKVEKRAFKVIHDEQCETKEDNEWKRVIDSAMCIEGLNNIDDKTFTLVDKTAPDRSDQLPAGCYFDKGGKNIVLNRFEQSPIQCDFTFDIVNETFDGVIRQGCLCHRKGERCEYVHAENTSVAKCICGQTMCGLNDGDMCYEKMSACNSENKFDCNEFANECWPDNALRNVRNARKQYIVEKVNTIETQYPVCTENIPANEKCICGDVFKVLPTICNTNEYCYHRMSSCYDRKQVLCDINVYNLEDCICGLKKKKHILDNHANTVEYDKLDDQIKYYDQVKCGLGSLCQLRMYSDSLIPTAKCGTQIRQECDPYPSPVSSTYCNCGIDFALKDEYCYKGNRRNETHPPCSRDDFLYEECMCGITFIWPREDYKNESIPLASGNPQYCYVIPKPYQHRLTNYFCDDYYLNRVEEDRSTTTVKKIEEYAQTTTPNRCGPHFGDNQCDENKFCRESDGWCGTSFQNAQDSTQYNGQLGVDIETDLTFTYKLGINDLEQKARNCVKNNGNTLMVKTTYKDSKWTKREQRPYTYTFEVFVERWMTIAWMLNNDETFSNSVVYHRRGWFEFPYCNIHQFLMGLCTDIPQFYHENIYRFLVIKDYHHKNGQIILRRGAEIFLDRHHIPQVITEYRTDTINPGYTNYGIGTRRKKTYEFTCVPQLWSDCFLDTINDPPVELNSDGLYEPSERDKQESKSPDFPFGDQERFYNRLTYFGNQNGDFEIYEVDDSIRDSRDIPLNMGGTEIICSKNTAITTSGTCNCKGANLDTTCYTTDDKDPDHCYIGRNGNAFCSRLAITKCNPKHSCAESKKEKCFCYGEMKQIGEVCTGYYILPISTKCDQFEELKENDNYIVTKDVNDPDSDALKAPSVQTIVKILTNPLDYKKIWSSVFTLRHVCEWTDKDACSKLGDGYYPISHSFFDDPCYHLLLRSNTYNISSGNFDSLVGMGGDDTNCYLKKTNPWDVGYGAKDYFTTSTYDNKYYDYDSAYALNPPSQICVKHVPWCQVVDKNTPYNKYLFTSYDCYCHSIPILKRDVNINKWIWEPKFINKDEEKFCFQHETTKKTIIVHKPCEYYNRVHHEASIKDIIISQDDLEEICYCSQIDEYCQTNELCYGNINTKTCTNFEKILTVGRKLTVIDNGKCSDLDEGLWEPLYDEYLCWKHRFLLTYEHKNMIIMSDDAVLKYNSSHGNSLHEELDMLETKDMHDKTGIYGDGLVGEGCTLSWISDKTTTWENIHKDEMTLSLNGFSEFLYGSPTLPNEDCMIPSLAEWVNQDVPRYVHGVNALNCDDTSDLNQWPNFYIKKNSISQNKARVVPKLKAGDKLRPLGLTLTVRDNEIELENGELEVKLKEASHLTNYIGRDVEYKIVYNQRKICISKAPSCSQMYTNEDGFENYPDIDFHPKFCTCGLARIQTCNIRKGMKCLNSRCSKFDECSIDNPLDSSILKFCRCQDNMLCHSQDSPYCLPSGICTDLGNCKDKQALVADCQGEHNLTCSRLSYYSEFINACGNQITHKFNINGLLTHGKCSDVGNAINSLKSCREYNNGKQYATKFYLTSDAYKPYGCSFNINQHAEADEDPNIERIGHFNSFNSKRECSVLNPCVCKVYVPVCVEGQLATENCICGRKNFIAKTRDMCAHDNIIPICLDETQTYQTYWPCVCGDNIAEKKQYCLKQNDEYHIMEFSKNAHLLISESDSCIETNFLSKKFICIQKSSDVHTRRTSGTRSSYFKNIGNNILDLNELANELNKHIEWEFGNKNTLFAGNYPNKGLYCYTNTKICYYGVGDGGCTDSFTRKCYKNKRFEVNNHIDISFGTENEAFNDPKTYQDGGLYYKYDNDQITYFLNTKDINCISKQDKFCGIHRFSSDSST